MAIKPSMLQMQNNLVAAQPQQSMNKTILAVSPAHHGMNANTSSTHPGPFEQKSVK